MDSEAPHPGGLGRRGYAWGLALVVVVGAALRIWHLGSQSLWFDEARFLEAALRPDFASLVKFMIEEDYHPPLYPLVLKGWVALFGTSDAAVRALPALAGLALVPLTAWLTMLLARDRRASLVAALFVALGSYHLYLSQEGRHYTWLAALGVLNIIAYVQVLRYGRKRWLATLGLTAVIGSLSHYYMLLMIVGQIAFAARARVRLRGTVLAVLAASVFVFVLVWGGPFVEQGRQRAAWGGGGLIDPLSGPLQALEFILQSISWTAVDFSFGRAILLLGSSGFDWPDVGKSLAVLAATGLGVWGLVQLSRRKLRFPFSVVGLIAAVGALPVGLAIASSLTEAMLYDTKYVSFAAPLWALAVAVGFASLRGRLLTALVALLLVAGLAASALEFHLEAIPWKENWSAAAELLNQRWHDGDALLQRAPYTAFCLDHYLGWTPSRLSSPGANLPPKLSVAHIAEELHAMGARRLWVISSHDEHGAALRELLAHEYPRTGTWALRGITIALYAPLSEDGTGAPER
jgi:mannosyltransferase